MTRIPSSSKAIHSTFESAFSKKRKKYQSTIPDFSNIKFEVPKIITESSEKEILTDLKLAAITRTGNFSKAESANYVH